MQPRCFLPCFALAATACALPAYDTDPSVNARILNPTAATPQPVELLSTEVLDSGWVGGDPAQTGDDPAGIQGGIYAYGDEVACIVPDNAGNPCRVGEGCCLDWTTIDDPDFDAWGCGLGLELKVPNPGVQSDERKQPYPGPAKGFQIGYVNTPDTPVRINYTQTGKTEDVVQPFVTPAGSGTHTVLFSDVACPNWPGAVCMLPGPTPFDLQLQVVGGDAANSGRLCITSIVTVY